MVFAISLGAPWLQSGVHTAKAEECTTPLHAQEFQKLIGVGGLHGNKFAKNSPAKIRMRKQFTSFHGTLLKLLRAMGLKRGWLAHATG